MPVSRAEQPPAERNVQAQAGGIARPERHAALRTSGATLWFTGLSGSGKSTITGELERELIRRGRFCYRLDGDNIRLGLNRDLGFSAEDRHENIRRIGEVAHLFADAGVIALVGFISPYRADRDVCRRAHEQSALGGGGPLPFLEVFVDTPLDVCERRDPKGLYKKARAGNLPHFTGIDDPYEAPLKPELVLRTATMGVEECVRACTALLRDRGMIDLA